MTLANEPCTATGDAAVPLSPILGAQVYCDDTHDAPQEQAQDTMIRLWASLSADSGNRYDLTDGWESEHCWASCSFTDATGNVRYYATPPHNGGATSCEPGRVPAGGTRISAYHSHSTKCQSPERFAPGDFAWSPNYMISPAGFDPDGDFHQWLDNPK